MASKNYPATRMRLKKLLASDDFQEIQLRARADQENIRQYIIEARRKFGLSPYWNEFLYFILLSGFNPENLAGAAVVVTAHDYDVDKDYYHIAVYPETSLADVKHAYEVINERYAERGEKKRSRTSYRFDIEVKAAKWSDDGLSNKEILEQLVDDPRPLTLDQIPGLITKGHEKIAKAKTDI